MLANQQVPRGPIDTRFAIRSVKLPRHLQNLHSYANSCLLNTLRHRAVILRKS
jgi:hypothetical protein